MMEDRFLFRGKRVDDGEWAYGGFDLERNGVSWIYDKDLPRDNEVAIFPETLGQCTGLKDNNGNLIFEGDILQVLTQWEKGEPVEIHDDLGFGTISKYKTLWTVEYKRHNTQMGFFTYGIDRRWFKPLTWSRAHNSKAEIVGTIYDNPSLLK